MSRRSIRCGRRRIRRASLRGLSSVGTSDRTRPWIARHTRDRVRHLHQFPERRAGNSDCRKCVLHDRARNGARVSCRRPSWCLSRRSAGRSKQRPGDSQWAGLYISRRGCGCSERGKYRRWPAWKLPSWLLFERWRDDHNPGHHGDPHWPRRVHLQAWRGADYRCQFLRDPGRWRLRERRILGSRRRDDAWSERCNDTRCTDVRGEHLSRHCCRSQYYAGTFCAPDGTGVGVRLNGHDRFKYHRCPHLRPVRAAGASPDHQGLQPQLPTGQVGFRR